VIRLGKVKRVDFEYVRYTCPGCGETWVECVRMRAAYVRSSCCDVRVPLNAPYDFAGGTAQAEHRPTPFGFDVTSHGTEAEKKGE
jgi:hypothetical protein